jgi:hypothetical protein
MVGNPGLGDQIIARELLIQTLLGDAALVGGIYTMGYDECLVLTNDLWKRQAGGVPQHCFLLATAVQPGRAPEIEDEEVILLRVIGAAALPAEAELVHVRAEAMREMVTARGAEGAVGAPAILDVLTRNEIQFSAIKAKVLGTFFETAVNGVPILAFGSDVETFYSSSRYKVYKPFGASLARIASYPESTDAEELARQGGGPAPRRLRVGTVRYSSTNRRRRMHAGGEHDTAVPVRVNVQDFIALKTAVFGMTRLGKSNSMKTLATAIAQYAAEAGQAIGQLLFDPTGEYASINVQDRTALSAIGNEFVTIFRYGATGDEPGVRPLSSNFFSDETMEVTWQIITAHLRQWTGTAYIDSFLAADVIGPETLEENPSAYNRARRRRAALFAALMRAGFEPPEDLSITIVASAEVLEAINQGLDEGLQFRAAGRGQLRLTRDTLRRFWDKAAREHADGHLPDGWFDEQLDAIVKMYTGAVGAGYRRLEPLRVYHSLARADDYAEEVLNELIAGKIVIADLSLGSETVGRFCSERIINHIVRDAAARFASGQDLHQIQIYIEEAHKLFNREKRDVPEEADPYVMLAKEAAKFRIGLTYATQEVSSVDPLILSNTSNWVVTHLNNHNEVKELSKYYDFEDFADLTLKAEDVGFARIKTRSGRYIIPLQIDLFAEARIVEARTACLRAAGARR